MHRLTVALRNKNGKYTVPKFSECLLNCFGRDINSVFVKCFLENGILVLSESEDGYELQHSPVCPFKLSTDNNNISEENSKNIKNEASVGLAASIVIESSDSYVLLTKRAAHMRSSPNAWVLPGGHLELGETIFEAAARETKEETALDITNETLSILGLWENAYPSFLGAGVPKYHILVVYLHTCLNETYTELSKKIIPDPEEVNAYCWLNKAVLSKLFGGNGNNKCDGKQYVFENGKVVERYLDYCSMFNSWLRTQPKPYSGVNFALRKWMGKNTDGERVAYFLPEDEETPIIVLQKKPNLLYLSNMQKRGYTLICITKKILLP